MGNYLAWGVSFFYKSPAEYLKDAELEILQKCSNTSCQSQFIPISNRVEIRTLRYDSGLSRGSTPVVVFVHGFLSGLGVWSPCFDLLSQQCVIYAIDLPGFGRSSRADFYGDLHDIEYQFVSSLEEWRDAVGIDSFIIVGHGFGGYIATLYAMKYPVQVRHLILVEPWGFTELPFSIVGKAVVCSTEHEQAPYKSRIPFSLQALNHLISFLSPFLLLRCLPRKVGSWICGMILKMTAPILSSTKELNDSMSNYLYHCTSLRASGEYAFLKSSMLFFWAKSPLIERIKQLDDNVPVSFIYGGKSSVDHKTGFEVFHQRQQSIVEVYMVQNAGHNVFMDCPGRFCDILLHVIEAESHKESSFNKILSPSGSELGTDDLYWDCAWETINLSTANLNNIERCTSNTLQEYWGNLDLSNEDIALTDDDVYYPLD